MNYLDIRLARWGSVMSSSSLPLYGIESASDRAKHFAWRTEVMPATRMVFEREIREISRTALQLEKLMVYPDSVPSPVHYQQILNRLSELYRMWRDHRSNQSRLMATLLSKQRQSTAITEDLEESALHLEQQLKAVSISAWPRSAQGGLYSIRVSASGILKSLFQQIAGERATCAPMIQRRRTSLRKSPQMLPSVAGLLVKQMDTEFHSRSLLDHLTNPKCLPVANRQ